MTDAQVKEFWEGCGLHYENYDTPAFPHQGGAWLDTNGKLANEEEPCNPPSLDLNNLFKYAVPKIRENYVVELTAFKDKYSVVLWHGEDYWKETQGKDPALALFKACYPIITGKEVTHDR